MTSQIFCLYHSLWLFRYSQILIYLTCIGSSNTNISITIHPLGLKINNLFKLNQILSFLIYFNSLEAPWLLSQIGEFR